MNSFSEIAQAIKNYDTFYISGHINPDGDSIGSCNCLKLALEKYLNCSTVLTGGDVLCYESQDKLCFVQVDVQPDYRIDKEALKVKKNASLKICFDHHQIEDSNCDLFYIDPNAAANSLII